jgi:hypothetical protein
MVHYERLEADRSRGRPKDPSDRSYSRPFVRFAGSLETLRTPRLETIRMDKYLIARTDAKQGK